MANCICFNFGKFPKKKSQVANEQKNRSVMHGNSRAQKVILGHKRKARGHIEYKTHEARGT